LAAGEDSITGFSEGSQEDNNMSHGASVTCDDTSNMSAILENSTDAQFPDNCESNGSNDNNSYLKRESVQNDNSSKRHKN
jgi:hypothetical protein